MTKTAEIDLRKAARQLEIKVQFKNGWFVWLGMRLIILGCWISGATLVDEFPISMYQPGDPGYQEVKDDRGTSEDRSANLQKLLATGPGASYTRGDLSSRSDGHSEQTPTDSGGHDS